LTVLTLGGKESVLYPGLVHRPKWSPNGTQIAFGYGAHPARLLVVNLRGALVRQLTGRPGRYDTESNLGVGSWSPDGSHIAFVRGPELHVASLAGSDDHTVHREAEMIYARASWSPGGSMLAFSSPHVVYVVRADGTRLVALAKGDLGTYEPKFRPGARSGDPISPHPLTTTTLPPEAYVLALDRSEVARGGRISVSGTGFCPSTPVLMVLMKAEGEPDSPIIGEALTDPQAVLNTEVRIPRRTAPGLYRLMAADRRTSGGPGVPGCALINPISVPFTVT
jgi:hypothetical protein